MNSPPFISAEPVDSPLFGKVETIKLTPRMPFKGLYDKSGATVIWLSDDSCRIPVQVNTEIVVGSMTATLIAYENPFCAKYSIYSQLP